jgi:hypothetical protein
MKGNVFMQLEGRRRGTEVPSPLGVLFGQEDTLVLLARRACPKKLEGQLAAPSNE